MNYQVLRPFSGYATGTKLEPGEFINEYRAMQLVEQRYLAVVPSTAEGYQPSVATLLSTSIRDLRAILPDVVDACVLEGAMASEERQVARQMYEKRKGELTDEREAVNATANH